MVTDSSAVGRGRGATRPSDLPPTWWTTLALVAALNLLVVHTLPLAWFATIVCALLLLDRCWRARRPIRPSPLAVSLGVLLVGTAIGRLVVIGPDMAADLRLYGLLAALMACVLVSDLVISPVAARRTILALLLMVVVLAPVVLVLSASGLQPDRLPSGIAAWQGDVVDVADTLKRAVPALGGFESRYRLYGSGVGALAAVGIALALGQALGTVPRWVRLLALMTVPFFAVGLLLSGSRGAVLGAAVAVAAMLGARAPRRAVGALLVAALAGTMLAGGMVLAGRLAPLSAYDQIGADPTNLYSRFDIWRRSLALLGDFPLTGLGLGLRSPRLVYESYFAVATGRLGIDATGEMRIVPNAFSHAHNAYLQALLEQGPLGLVGLLGAIGAGAIIGIRLLRSTEDPAAWSAAASATGMLVALACAGLTDIVLVTPIGTLLLFISLGVLAGLSRVHASRSTTERAAGTRWPLPSWPELSQRRGRALGGAAAVAAMSVVAIVAASLASASGGAGGLGSSLRQGAASVALNVGAVEVMRATLDDSRSGDAREARLASAERLLGRARELDTSDPRAPRLLAVASLERERRADALDLLDESRGRVDAQDSNGFFQLGRLYREAGAVDEALAAWSRVDPSVGARAGDSVYTHLCAWAAQAARRGDLEVALQVGEVAVAVGPEAPVPYPILARAQRALRGDAGAIAYFDELARRYPRVPWPHFELAALHRRNGQLERALAADRHGMRLQEALVVRVRYSASGQ